MNRVVAPEDHVEQGQNDPTAVSWEVTVGVGRPIGGCAHVRRLFHGTACLACVEMPFVRVRKAG